MKHRALLILMIWGLTGCQPKGTFLYQYPEDETFAINHTILVIDYLNLKDDLGQFWDFDGFYHQRVLNQLLHDIDGYLQAKGYPAIDGYILSSGLLIKSQFSVDHYIQDVPQQEALQPPFILAHQDTDTKQIEQHQEVLGLLVKYIAQRKHSQQDPLSHRGMQLGYQMASMNIPEDTVILYVHIDLSAPGAIKQLSTFLMAGAVASQADYAQVHFNPTATQHASAFLLHKGSGQILWKNYSTSWHPEQSIDILLKGF
jgi:hypothetical protein